MQVHHHDARALAALLPREAHHVWIATEQLIQFVSTLTNLDFKSMKCHGFVLSIETPRSKYMHPYFPPQHD